MTSSLIPERPLLISPTLAATIGLEEAVMLHVFSELLLQHPPIYRNQRHWAEINQSTLVTALPFWLPAEIKQIQRNLLEMGLLQIEAITGKADSFLYAINLTQNENISTMTSTMASTRSSTMTTPSPAMTPESSGSHVQSQEGLASSIFDTKARYGGGQKTRIPPDWQPNDTLYQTLSQRNIPHEFAEQRIRGFIMYWRERGDTQFSWHNTFLKRMIFEWEQARSYKGAQELESNMSAQWLPSGDALSILEHAGISTSFIEDAVPEFILFWREKGLVTSMWNTKFIAHIRRQWGKFTLALEHDNTPRLIPEDYQPSTPCYEVLAMANIDLDFARDQVKEFIMYWQERKDAYPSWNTKFLQHVKYRWANQHQSALPIIEKITDRSWAE